MGCLSPGPFSPGRMYGTPGGAVNPSHVALVVVNYNAGARLAECVTSALAQVGEVVVVDNASTDGSLAVVERYAGDGAPVRVLRNTANLGFAQACNLGAAQVERLYLLFLNPDCVLAPDAVARLVAALEARPEAGMAGGLLLNADGTEQAGGRRGLPTPWHAFVRAFGLARFFGGFDLHRQPLPDVPIEVEAISGACMLVRRAAMAQVGPLDEGYFMHCEDLDWCLRFNRAGWKVLFVPDARVVHHKGTCSRARPIFVEWHKHRGMLRFYRKFFRDRYPGPLMGLVVLGVWLRFAMLAARHGVAHARRWLLRRPD